MLPAAPPLGADALPDYRPYPGAYDELVDEQGYVRPHWRSFLSHLEQLGPAEVQRRWAQSQALIHENGVSYNVHGDPRGLDRPWPLAPLPVMMPPAAWSDLVAALSQRARLMELVLEDLHGPQRLLHEGLIPSA